MAIKTQVTTKYFNEKGFEFSNPPIEETIIIKKIDEGFSSKYLTQDQFPESPDTNGDENLFIVHYHRDFWVERKDKIREGELAELYQGSKIEQEKEYYIFPVKAYIHSGVSLSLGQGGFGHDPGGWDTSHVGAILVSKKEWKDRGKAEAAAEALIEEWNQYLSGDVYCIVQDQLDKKKTVLNTAVVCGYSGLKYAKEELKGFDDLQICPRGKRYSETKKRCI